VHAALGGGDERPRRPGVRELVERDADMGTRIGLPDELDDLILEGWIALAAGERHREHGLQADRHGHRGGWLRGGFVTERRGARGHAIGGGAGVAVVGGIIIAPDVCSSTAGQRRNRRSAARREQGGQQEEAVQGSEHVNHS